LFHLFQHYGAIQAQVCPKNGVVYGSEWIREVPGEHSPSP
jgi:hypothetical protein